MKDINILFVMMVLCALAACNHDKKSPESSSESMQIEVEKAASKLNALMIDPNREDLNEITADKLTYGHSSGNIQSKDVFIDDLLNGPFSFNSIDISKQTIDISGDVAVVRHILDAEGTNSGTPVHVNIGIMLVFQNHSGQWKLLARQAYKL